jgi:hypothetical protein
LLSKANCGTTEIMARSKATPERSRLDRKTETAFAKRQRTGEGEGEAKESKDDSDDEDNRADEETKPEFVPGTAADMPTQPISAAQVEAAKAANEKKDLPAIEPPPPKGEPWPDATPEPMKPVERPRTETMVMPTVGQFGGPPAMPRTSAPPPLTFGTVEDPTHMPGPREIPGGNPEDPAPAPGRVPPGDSRSLRRDNEFALVYRMGTYVISRFGTVGTRGQWRVVEYPTSSSASHSYAKECSRFVSEGFSDYRD